MKQTFEKLGKIIYDDNHNVIAIESEQSNGLGEGYIFKDMEAFHNKKGLCYMSEQDIIDYDDDCPPVCTEEELIENYGIDYNMAIKLVKEVLEYEGLPIHNFICEHIAQSILENAEWASFSTYLNQIENLDEWVDEIIANSNKNM